MSFESSANACDRASPSEAELTVTKAAKLVEKLGIRAALLRFVSPRGGFRTGELYVFVLDRRGIIQGDLGQDVAEVRDPKGRYFVKEMIRVATRRGAGWVAYEWYDPCTGLLAEKQTFVKRAGEYVVAAGIYGAIRL